MRKGIDYIGIGVVFACHDGRGNFLFAKRGNGARDGHGLWEIPAGGLEVGETIEEGMLRELKEEHKVEPISFEFMGHKDVITKGNGTILKHWIAFEYLVLVDPEKVQIGEPESCDAIEWRSLDNVPSDLHHGTDSTIENIKKFLSRKKS